VSGAKKRKMDYVRVVLKLMENVRNGNNQMDAQYISVPENIRFSFVDYVMNFRVNG
jgi:hypothetical protein